LDVVHIKRCGFAGWAPAGNGQLFGELVLVAGHEAFLVLLRGDGVKE
jgi:hypothetical protein